MAMIKCVIVEDDPKYSDRLAGLLDKCEEQVVVMAIETNVDDALVAIQKFSPDLVFLDIQLERGQSGFDLLKRIETISFDVIFTTSHVGTDNTIKAIRACALDFLPKPVSLGDLQTAIKRYTGNKANGNEQIRTLKQNLESHSYKSNNIFIASGSEYMRVETRNILYCISENTSTDFFIMAGNGTQQKYTSTKSIGEWETIFENSNLVRIHNRYIVNLDQILRYSKSDGGQVFLPNEIILPVSAGKKEGFEKKLGLKKT